MPYMDTATLNAVFLDDDELALKTLTRHPIAPLVVTSGAIVACDPLVQPDAAPFSRRVTPGQYPTEYLANDVKPALLVLWLRDRDTVDPATLTWEMAVTQGQDQDVLEQDAYYGYPVDAGLGCFMDANAAQAMAEREEREADFDNYYDDVLAAEINDAAQAFEHCPSGHPGDNNIILCESGWGDGTYPSYWALDPSGEPLALVTDFMVIENDDGRTTQEIETEHDEASLSAEKHAGLIALHAAIVAGDADAVATLCAHGRFSVNDIIPGNGGTAIYEAIRLNQPDVLAALLAGGPCPEMPEVLKFEEITDYLSYARMLCEAKEDGPRPFFAWRKKKKQAWSPALIEVLKEAVKRGQPRPTPPGFVSVPVGLLVERYSLSHLRSYTGCIDQIPQPSIAVYEGDLSLDGLDLDIPGGWYVGGDMGYLITGNLRVNGNITNEQDDGALSLVVLGDLHAKNIAIGGQNFYVRGNVNVEGVFCGSYNHGETHVDGNLSAGLLISNDYRFWIRGHLDAKLATTDCDKIGLLEGRTADPNSHGSDDSDIGYGGARWIEGKIPIFGALSDACLDEDLDDLFSFGLLVDRLRQGLAVIRPDCSDDPATVAALHHCADLFEQAEAAYYEDDWDTAAALYEQAEAAGYPPKPCRYSRGICLYEEEDDLDEAIRLLSWCIEQDFMAAACLIRRASARLFQIYNEETDDEDAAYAAVEADCQRVIEGQDQPCDDQRAEAYNLLGVIFRDQEHYKKALKPLAAALELDGNSYNANQNTGKCLKALGRIEEAIPYFEKAAQIEPTDEHSREYLEACYDEFLDRLIKKRRLDEAYALATKLVKMNPAGKMVNADAVLADRLRKLKRQDQALEYAKRAIDANPEPGDHYRTLGLCLATSRDLDGAIAAWNVYTEYAPEDFQIWQLLAAAHASLNDIDTANRCAQKAKEAHEAEYD